MRAKQSNQTIRTLRRRQLALALVAAMAVPAAQVASAQNQPSGGSVVSGTATINTTGFTTTINQSSRGAIIDWGSFSIGTGYGVDFQNGSGVTLNRVIGFGYGGPAASTINGSLTSTGTVFLINRAGIAFGGGATINVGGLIASTIDMSNADFNAGVDSRNFVFGGGAGAGAGDITNYADITAAAGGTIGFLGQNITNYGDIVAPGGSVVFGAASAATITLDPFGDGLTQLVIQQPAGAGGGEILNYYGSVTADGGQILMRTDNVAGGTSARIVNAGTLRARSLASRAGRIELTAGSGDVLVGGFPDGFRAGLIDVSGGTFAGGSALLSGNTVAVLSNPVNPAEASRIDADGGAGGGRVDLFAIDEVTLSGGATISASSTSAGNGGLVRAIAGGNVDINGNVSADAGPAGGNGGGIGLQSTAGNVVVTGTLRAVGSSTGDGGDVALVATAGGAAVTNSIRVDGGVNGGSMQILAGTTLFTETANINANGGSGAGGDVTIAGSALMAAYGTVTARGGGAGGNVLTYSGGNFDVRGFAVDAGSAGTPGTWTLWAPNINVIDGQATGSVRGFLFAQNVQDADINRALDNSTNVTLRAGVAGNGGNVYFNPGVDVVRGVGSVPLTLRVNADGAIGGDNFAIRSTAGALGMVFNADASSINNGSGGIRFNAATLSSNGGDISMYGQSDPAAGRASSFDSGIQLIASSITTGAGNVLLRGASTGGDAGAGDAGVVLDGTNIATTIGNVGIDGIGAGVTGGVALRNGSIATGAGAVAITGVGAAGPGIQLDTYNITTGGGAIGLDGGSSAGAGISINASRLASAGGAVSLLGTSASGIGVRLGVGNGFAIDSGGGAININGTGGSDGVVLEDSLNPVAIASGGGAIDITGSGTASGVTSRNNLITSLGGRIAVTGTATGPGAVGVDLPGTRLVAGSGNVSVTGTAANGDGVRFGPGTSGPGGISTTTGAIAVTGTGLNVGLDITGAALDTVSGNLTLTGTALGASAIAGVLMNTGTLATSGGNIAITGTSAGGSGVLFGQGGGFTIGSGGGDITITGTGVAAGTSLTGGTVNSGGGDIDVTGSASGADATGVALAGTRLVGTTGDVTVTGTAVNGRGIVFARNAQGVPSGIDTTSGAITLVGRGANFGIDLGEGAINTVSGDLTLDGAALATTATAGVRVTGGGLTTNGGDVTVRGTSAGGVGVGVQLGDGSPFAIGSGGGAINITGRGAAGVVMLGYGASRVDSGGGAIAITGDGVRTGVQIEGTSIAGGAGAIGISGSASGPGGIGVVLSQTGVRATTGDITVRGTAPSGSGIIFPLGSGFSTSSGAINLIGRGANVGLDADSARLDTVSGDILLDGIATSTTGGAGVEVRGGNLTTNGGDIIVRGTSAGGVGVGLGGSGAFAIGSGGGAISIAGSGVFAGVSLRSTQVASGGGAIDIDGNATGSGASGVSLSSARLNGGAGDVDVDGIAINGTGVRFADVSGITTTTGDISVTGIGSQVGLTLAGGELRTDSGQLDLRGRGMGAASDGLVIGTGVRIATNGGGIALSGEGGSGAGVVLQSGSSVAAGNSLVVVRAGNDGSSDALRIGGTISSGMGVNLRPGGVDPNGGLTERTGDLILIGGGTNGFALSGTELAFVDAPELVIGSNLHAGAIRVLGATNRNGNLTLQNDGGSGGIDLQAPVNVGTSTLALSSGGSITQTSAGAIAAQSLLARAGGNVLLAVAANDVSANTLAGSAGGDFRFQDVDNLSIGNVSARGFDANAGQLSNLAANGVSAGGDVFVRNLAGDLTLNAGVAGSNIDLVTAGRLQNLASASLSARGAWRVWANTWQGETRGGLAGSGNLPNLYGCAYQGACGVTVSGGENHFIYVQQPTALVTFNSFSREYGLPNPLLTFSVTGAILGDTAANVASGSATTTATIGSDVGNYPITGNFLSAAGYRIQFVPGNLAVTPATLFFTADNFVRFLGTSNPPLTGNVTGFRNGDTVQSVFGSGVIWSTPAGLLSPIGFYPVNGGTTARNYVFSQAPGNATALRIVPLPQLPSTPIDFIRDTINTYVYDRNIGGAPVCAINASMADQQLASAGDELSNEWSKVRSRPNLTNCFESDRKNSCGDF